MKTDNELNQGVPPRMKKTGWKCIPPRFIAFLREILVENINLRPSDARQPMIDRLGYFVSSLSADFILDCTVQNKVYALKSDPQL